jgi:hypothetical protein
MRFTRRQALAAPLLLSACGKGPSPTTTPFREANDHVVIPVTFRGHPTCALLDNGAPLTSLDQTFARNAGLAKSVVGAGLDPLDMQIEDAAVRVHPYVEDMTEAAIATDAPVGAIAGMEIFKAFVVALTFSRGEIGLHRRPFRRQAGSISLRLDEGEPPHPGVEISIEGKAPLRAYVDLGSSAALLISPRLAESLGVGRARKVSTRQVILSSAEGLGLGVSRLTSIDRLNLGEWTMRDVPIDILPEDARPFAGIDAAIGVPLLRRFDIALDLPGRLHLSPNDRIASPFERRRTGLQTKPQGSALLVRHVAAGSPAEASGFVAGDVLTAIDGKPPLMRTLREAKQDQQLMIKLADGRNRRLTASRYY